MRRQANTAFQNFLEQPKMHVKCDKCGKEAFTRFFQRGQIHKGCGGKFVVVKVV